MNSPAVVTSLTRIPKSSNRSSISFVFTFVNSELHSPLVCDSIICDFQFQVL